MKLSAFLLAAASLLAAADAPKKFTGIVGDNMCKGDHANMQQGTTPEKCTRECVEEMGARYALWVGKNVYILSDQNSADKFAGRKVTVTGVLTGDRLTVRSIKASR